MSSTDRQNRLLVAEDWKRIYQTFRNADFQSYDFDNLRRTMINYLRQNYPEDFNDYIESSEYLALIDLIAYLGQNISFRIDLNARENFLELAERRESVLRMARLLSYNVKRNQPANGLLKFDAVSTTENITDSNGINLSGQTIQWNDSTNPDWYEQFIKVINAALPVNGIFGKPNKKITVGNIPTEQYKFNAINTDIPTYSFSKTIDGVSYPFEVVSTDLDDENIIEELPIVGNSLSFVYRNDNQGSGSTNTGFFAHFRQGKLENGQFSVTNPVPNQTIDIDARNINNVDVWLYKLNSAGAESEYWTKVESVEGNNVIYNSLNKNIRTFYNVITRTDDRISLAFADGTFGDLPKGNFRVYYRTSANRRMTINPREMSRISIKIPYLSKTGKTETLTVTLGLKYTVDNSAVSETSANIKASAPRLYYTQNRMITAEDYNVTPLSSNQNIIKSKAVNRTSSGISRFYDLIDATGKYSNTNLFAQDGILYKELKNTISDFTFTTRTDVEGIIYNTITPELEDVNLLNYYYSEFPNILVRDLNASWIQSTSATNSSTGYFVDADARPYDVGSFTSNQLKNIVPGTLVRFVAPNTQTNQPQHFMTSENNKIMAGEANHPNAVSYIWTKVISVAGDGTTVTNGTGPIVFNDIIPTNAVIDVVIPRLAITIPENVISQIIDQMFAYNPFGLRYDTDAREWKLITESNLDVYGSFSIGKTGDNSNQQLDSSWLLLFTTDGEKYTMEKRTLRYVFESVKECRFYVDPTQKIYDTKTGKTIKDKVNVLSINTEDPVNSTQPFTVDYPWEIIKEYRDSEGYVDSSKIEVSFYDSDDDYVVDNPELFDIIVKPTTDVTQKYIIHEKYSTIDGTEEYRYIDNSNNFVKVRQSRTNVDVPYSVNTNGQLYYFIDENTFYNLNTDTNTLERNTNYKAYVGRDKIKFQYIHNADMENRIDPSSSNIMDIYLLTKGYDTSYRQWLNGAITSQPLPPSSDALFNTYGRDFVNKKAMSDEIILHPVKYKPLFGSKAEFTVQGQFKIVKNPDLVLNDNDIKTRVISAINQFFALENWEFGETFYFSELSAFIMNKLAPDVVTVVIVPNQADKSFGTLYEIRSESDEIFINAATIDNVSIIDSLTASKLQASGNISSNSLTSKARITSSTTSTTSYSSSNDNTGGYY